jgi:hypothetical protein
VLKVVFWQIGTGQSKRHGWHSNSVSIWREDGRMFFLKKVFRKIQQQTMIANSPDKREE